jgi:hypothetical protein
MSLISKSDARALAALIIDDVKNYAASRPVEYAEFVAAERAKAEQQTTPQVKRRRSRKSKMPQSVL